MRILKLMFLVALTMGMARSDAQSVPGSCVSLQFYSQECGWVFECCLEGGGHVDYSTCQVVCDQRPCSVHECGQARGNGFDLWPRPATGFPVCSVVAPASNSAPKGE